MWILVPVQNPSPFSSHFALFAHVVSKSGDSIIEGVCGGKLNIKKLYQFEAYSHHLLYYCITSTRSSLSYLLGIPLFSLLTAFTCMVCNKRGKRSILVTFYFLLPETASCHLHASFTVMLTQHKPVIGTLRYVRCPSHINYIIANR